MPETARNLSTMRILYKPQKNGLTDLIRSTKTELQQSMYSIKSDLTEIRKKVVSVEHDLVIHEAELNSDVKPLQKKRSLLPFMRDR